ncbi:MAG: hypothetical protein U1A77_20195 [Pirellulales bacterium]
MQDSWREAALFVRQFTSRFESTGSLVPSSTALARAVASRVAKRGAEPIRVLECGPGTGAMTRQILPYLREGDCFDLVEVNSVFAEFLRGRLQHDPLWRAAAAMTTVHATRIEDFDPTTRYDYIVSGVPHINLPADVVREIVAGYRKLLRQGGTLSYFEYAYIRPVRLAITLGRDSTRVRDVDRWMATLREGNQATRETVFFNLPPAWVRHVVMLSTE